MEKELRIQVPEGMEIDRANSTFECIKFKPKQLTYEDIANTCHFTEMIMFDSRYARQAYVYGQLQEVADYLNKGWKPDWTDENTKWLLRYDANGIYPCCSFSQSFGLPVFKTETLAKEAIRIIGEENLKILFK